MCNWQTKVAHIILNCEKTQSLRNVFHLFRQSYAIFVKQRKNINFGKKKLNKREKTFCFIAKIGFVARRRPAAAPAVQLCAAQLFAGSRENRRHSGGFYLQLWSWQWLNLLLSRGRGAASSLYLISQGGGKHAGLVHVSAVPTRSAETQQL